MKKYSVEERRRKWSKIWLVIFLIAVIGLLTTVFILRRTYDRNLASVSSSPRPVLVTVPMGASVQEIGKLLQSKGLIRAPWAFEWYVRNHDVRDRLQAGTYSLRPNQSVVEIIDVLTHGKVSVSKVTIYPGKRLDQVRESLINDGFSPEAVDAALEPSQYNDSPALSDKPVEASLEGYLYPETFQKTADTKPEAIIRASLDEMHKHLTPEIRAGFTKQGLNVHQGVTLASIIEQEVSNVDDRPKVAQVFFKRLRSDKALESDTTANYGSILAGKEPDLDFDSPHNTYKHKGLPIGPISNITKSALEAVIKPANTDFLYFVASDDDEQGRSTTYFTNTLEEHEAKARQYCHKKCGR